MRSADLTDAAPEAMLDLALVGGAGSFPAEEIATKMIFLVIRNFEKGGRNVRKWFAARN
ncbi:hypothetical protein [Paracoccus jeotgali]|uniref:hypothetical protein n=1 Tax=Paracoccus jeotgali TaxID=2065379 RepID=UPI0013157945|nr:hypothetical protein [Paracoccus jeotgali]